jgi:hypothetical protein
MTTEGRPNRNKSPQTAAFTCDQGWNFGLERDYDGMQVMIFGEIPPFARIIETLAGLEEEINHQR